MLTMPFGNVFRSLSQRVAPRDAAEVEVGGWLWWWPVPCCMVQGLPSARGSLPRAGPPVPGGGHDPLAGSEVSRGGKHPSGRCRPHTGGGGTRTAAPKPPGFALPRSRNPVEARPERGGCGAVTDAGKRSCPRGHGLSTAGAAPAP